MNLAMIGSTLWGWIKRIPDWVLWAIGVILFLKFVDMNAERRGREKQKQSDQVKQAEIKAAVTERTSEIITEERTHADAAITARDTSPVYPDASGVPDEIGRVLFRGEGRDKAG